jgi:uncharacterized protein (DUF1330 family)
MKVENALEPTQAQMEAFLADAEDRPIHMVNLLKFRDKAAYPDGRDAEMSGREVYMFRYGIKMIEMVQGAGGSLTFSGEAASLLVGEVEEPWDTVAIVTYPSEAVMIELTQSPEFQEISEHRKAGLEGQLLIRCPAPAA